MHRGFLQIRSLTPSLAVKTQKQQGHHGEGRGGLNLWLGGIGRVWPRAPASTLPPGACGSGDSDSGLPSLWFPGCYPCCPSMQRADENSEPKVSPSPPLHAWLPCRSCPRADRLPFRPGCPSTRPSLGHPSHARPKPYLWIRLVRGSISFLPNLGSKGVRAPN